MDRSLRWNKLVSGLIAVACIGVVAVLILVFGRAGALHGRKFTVFVTTDAARGVIKGTEVWLDGQKIGLVSNVSFRPPSVRPDERIVMTLSILSRARSHIRKDTHIQVRSGLTVLGDQVIALSSGTPARPELRDGDTVRAGVQSDLEGITSDASMAAHEFPGIMENVKLLAAQMRTARGTLAALGVDDWTPTLRSVRARADRAMAFIGDTTGTVGLALRSSDSQSPIRVRASRAMAQVDSIRALLSSNQHSLGRFRRDSTLRTEVGRLRGELAATQRLMDSPTGTVGRFRADSALTRSMSRDRAELDSLFVDMKSHPIRYIAF
ncbi:MAG TPA: MlaD family protein [Gemmatimonadaceae bacterium]|nr:MlaD family protein [Gemmatimonadaceae bacterium]